MSAHGRDCPASPRIRPTQLGLHLVVHGNDMYTEYLPITIQVELFTQANSADFMYKSTQWFLHAFALTGVPVVRAL